MVGRPLGTATRAAAAILSMSRGSGESPSTAGATTAIRGASRRGGLVGSTAPEDGRVFGAGVAAPAAALSLASCTGDDTGRAGTVQLWRPFDRRYACGL